MLSYRYAGKTIPYYNSSSSVSILSGAIIVLVAGVKGIIGIATDTIAPLTSGALSIQGVHELTALTTDTGTQGETIYWDSVLNQLTVAAVNSTNSSNYNAKAGFLAEAKLNGDLTARVYLPGLINGDSPAPTALTNASLNDNSGGTASGTLAAVGSTYSQVVVGNAVASLAGQLNNLTTVLRVAGLIG